METEHDTSGLCECSQCGNLPATLEPEDTPEVLVLEENLGDPWMFGVRCRICSRVAKGIGKEAALKAWAAGAHDFDLDEFGNDSLED